MANTGAAFASIAIGQKISNLADFSCPHVENSKFVNVNDRLMKILLNDLISTRIHLLINYCT